MNRATYIAMVCVYAMIFSGCGRKSTEQVASAGDEESNGDRVSVVTREQAETGTALPGTDIQETSDALQPLLRRAQICQANADHKHAFVFFAIIATFADCPPAVRQARDTLVKRLTEEDGEQWGHRERTVPWRGERWCLLPDVLPEEVPSTEARLLADSQLTGNGEFEGLEWGTGMASGLAVTPTYHSDVGFNTYLLALDSSALRFVAPPTATWDYLTRTYGPPTILEEYPSGTPLVVRYGRTVLVLDEGGEVTRSCVGSIGQKSTGDVYADCPASPCSRPAAAGGCLALVSSGASKCRGTGPATHIAHRQERRVGGHFRADQHVALGAFLCT